ncbi:hypothetical protein EIN43_07815 [Enterobacter hormaechei]|uniref:Uncharacterized protein n=1 Tax=Enterobacter hormaechei TaxID=158836 RepID=A0A4Y5ZSR2_9ENTR|nr:hypothetical protein EIN43_07815 [Enterobacter hormaechei]
MGTYRWIIRLYREGKERKSYGFFSRDVDIEELYTEIEANLNRYVGKDAGLERIMAFKSYTQLIFIFSAVINSIQNGPISRPHSGKMLSNDDMVATFNWDTLMDRALNSETEWTTDYGYGFGPKAYTEIAGCRQMKSNPHHHFLSNYMGL